MPRRLPPVVVCLALLLAACSTERPQGAVCQGLCPRPEGPIALMRGTKGAETAREQPPSAIEGMASEAFGEQLRTLMRKKADAVPLGAPERALEDLPSEAEGRLRLLALSSGGPYGAFGAGFLNGWSGQTDEDLARPERFDIVTGVSAGALLASHAFLGRQGDAALKKQYTTTSTEDVFRQRSLLGAFFSNSFFDTRPLRRTLEGLVTPELLDQVAEATAVDPADGLPGRLLLALAVDLDSGRPRILDLGAIARDRAAPDRVDRYIDALMASAAIPVAFPPVFIDGAMHADGGARLALFFNRYMEEQRLKMEGRPPPAPKLDVIVNSETTLEPMCVENTLLGVGKRTVDVVLDQIALDSLYRTISEAERDGFEVRYVTADGSGCERPDDPVNLFQREFLQCLFAHGEAIGGGAAPWKSGLEDFPGLEIGRGLPSAPACGVG
jgi:hypothetical protein